MRWQPRGCSPGYVLDERGVGQDQPLTHPSVSIGLVSPPEFSQLDRFNIGLQGFLPPVSRPRVAARIGASKPGGLYPSVNLSAGHARVPEQLLDAPQVGSAIEQVRRKAVAQRVRRDRAT